jgi:hypothetical protein
MATGDDLRERLRQIDPLHTTPFEALQFLHELREAIMNPRHPSSSSALAPR